MAQPTTPVVENSNGTLAVIAGIMRGYFQAWKLEREIDALGSSEAARVLGEAGLDRADLLARPTRRTPMDDLLLETGMEACGIDREHLRAREPGWLRDMERTCMRCPVRSRCRRATVRGEFFQTHHEFCPNSRDLAFAREYQLSR